MKGEDAEARSAGIFAKGDGLLARLIVLVQQMNLLQAAFAEPSFLVCRCRPPPFPEGAPTRGGPPLVVALHV